MNIVNIADFSPIDIRALIEAKYDDPVISVYVATDQKELVPQEKGLLRTFHSMKTEVLKNRKDYIESLSGKQQRQLHEDLQEIETFLKENVMPEGFRSFIIFKSNERLSCVFRLRVRTLDALIIDPDPYIVPLEVALEENERVLFVEATKEESRFLLYNMGDCRLTHRIQSFVPSDTVDDSIPGHVQRHRLTHLQWHLKHTATMAYRLFAEGSCDSIVLMAERRIMALLEEFLHQSLKDKIAWRIYNSPDADARNRKELIEAAIRDHHADREAKAIEDLINYKPGEELISGLRNVIAATNLFRIRKLLASTGIRDRGFVCKGHHYVSLEGTECPFDGSKLLPVENILDEIVEVTRFYGVSVMLVEHCKDLLAKYDGIAAVVYPSASQS